MRRLIYDIIEEEAVNRINVTLTVDLIEAETGVPGTQRVKFCNDKWIRLFGFVNKEGNEVQVSEYGEDGYITFTIENPTDVFTLGEQVTLNLPIVINGTFKTARFEWVKMSEDEKEKLPCIWINTPVQLNNGADSSTLVQAPLKLWFFHYSDWSRLNKDRQDEAVRPLFALLDEFIKAIERNVATFQSYDGFNVRDYPIFGQTDQNGVTKTLIDVTSSALEIDLNVRIYKSSCEKC